MFSLIFRSTETLKGNNEETETLWYLFAWARKWKRQHLNSYCLTPEILQWIVMQNIS